MLAAFVYGPQTSKCHGDRTGVGLFSWWPEAERDKEKRRGRKGEKTREETGDRDRQMRQGKPRTRYSFPRHVPSEPLFHLAFPLVFRIFQK